MFSFGVVLAEYTIPSEGPVNVTATFGSRELRTPMTIDVWNSLATTRYVTVEKRKKMFLI